MVEACIAAGGEFLTGAKLFDVYVGQGVEEGEEPSNRIAYSL
ncbi:hypothetical protein O9993_08375 [Vibrio lentus]|nr:hypothetical protein [Vibrio lentus]